MRVHAVPRASGTDTAHFVLLSLRSSIADALVGDLALPEILSVEPAEGFE